MHNVMSSHLRWHVAVQVWDRSTAAQYPHSTVQPGHVATWACGIVTFEDNIPVRASWHSNTGIIRVQSSIHMKQEQSSQQYYFIGTQILAVKP